MKTLGISFITNMTIIGIIRNRKISKLRMGDINELSTSLSVKTIHGKKIDVKELKLGQEMKGQW